MNFKLKSYQKFRVKDYDHFIIAGDIGGTNTRIGFVGVKRKKFDVLFSLNYPSNSFNSLSLVLKHAKKTARDSIGIKIKSVALACAGPIMKNRNFCEMTNTSWNVDRKKLRTQTRMNILPLINDLEAIGHSLNYLDKGDLLKITSAKQDLMGNKIVIAAGTGLGKCKVYHLDNKTVTIPSEFGHHTFSASSKEDMKIVEFIRSHKRIRSQIESEQLISGKGIENLYDYYANRMKSPFKKEINLSSPRAPIIAKYKKRDPACRAALNAFTKYYARFAKNSALDDLPLGGLYITGTIAQENQDIFGHAFKKEFFTSETHQKLLKSIPIFVILNDDAGLTGAASFAANEV